jgi:pyridoxamine 5'-phosphate oxidase
VFYWADLERQVRIEGEVTRVAPEESDAYFDTRPMGARIGAWASPQSQVIAGRAELDTRLAAAGARFADGEVARPPHWGGYRVRPTLIEFWQGRPSRLHDRIQYRWAEVRWIIERLAP